MIIIIIITINRPILLEVFYPKMNILKSFERSRNTRRTTQRHVEKHVNMHIHRYMLRFTKLLVPRTFF
jgi:hypothetical protein